MIESEFIAALSSGAVKANVDENSAITESAGGAALPVKQEFSLSQFLPMLLQLQSTQAYLTAAPTFVPQTFQDQIQFVLTGGVYYLYLYFNNQWNGVPLSTNMVTKILAGTGISISPSGGTGNVTINSSAGLAVSGGSIPDVSSLTFTTSVQNNDTVVTHGLGTTPKLITITIGTFQVPGNATGTSVYTYATLYISFTASGTNVSGVSTYYVTGNTALVNAGNQVSWTMTGATNSGTMILEIVNVTSTTFTLRIAYSKANSNSLNIGSSTAMSYVCMG